MSHSPPAAPLVLPVYPAALMRVCDGVNLGDPVGQTRSLCCGDTYRLDHDATALSLKLDARTAANPPDLCVADGSEVSTPRVKMRIAARLTLMTPIGAIVDVLVLCAAGRRFIHPLGPLAPGLEYSLIEVLPDPPDIPLADLSGMCFGRGTRIALSDGTQRPVEALQVGDRVLTRDTGMKPILWIGRRTVQAVGAFAPVVISPGVLGNAENVTVAQHHHILISDWRAEVMVGTRDVLIQAKELVNGDSVFIREGGFIDYTQIVLDRHQVIYAEGIPTESLHISEQFLASLPPDLATEIRSAIPKDADSAEQPAARRPLDAAMAASLLRETGRI
ncbi:MAG: Hint domain-containing protein [Pseudomonadota bacterium]